MSSVNDTLKARGENYDRGDYENTAQVAQTIKSALRAGADSHWILMTAGMRESLDMIANKLARIVAGNPFHADSWHDIAGYATLGERSVQLDAGEFEAIPTMGLTAADASALYRALDGALGTIPAAEQTKTEDPEPTEPAAPFTEDTPEFCGDSNCEVCYPENAVDDEDDSLEDCGVTATFTDEETGEESPVIVVEESPGVYRCFVVDYGNIE